MSDFNLSKHDLVRHIEALNKKVASAGSDTETFVAYGRDNDLPPEALRTIVQSYNKVRSQNFMSKSANRGDDFTVFNADEITKAYVNDGLKSAGTVPAVVGHSALRRIGSCVKAASTPASVVDPVCKVVTPAYVEPEHKRAFNEDFVADREDFEGAGMLSGLKRDRLDSANKIAAYLRRNPAAFTKIEEAIKAAGTHGIYASALNDIAEFCGEEGIAVARAKVAKKQFVDAELMSGIEAIKLQSEAITALENLKVAGAGAAADTDADADTDTGKPRGRRNKSENEEDEDKPKNKEDKVEPMKPMPPYDLPVSLNPMPALKAINGSVSVPVGPRDTIKDLIDAGAGLPPADERQRGIDGAANKAKADAYLAELSLQDPVISQADPDTLQDIYASVTNAYPSAATDKPLLSSLLREHLQYGSVPMNTIKELQGLRKTKADADSAGSRGKESK